jgi:hypothetical protein
MKDAEVERLLARSEEELSRSEAARQQGRAASEMLATLFENSGRACRKAQRLHTLPGVSDGIYNTVEGVVLMTRRVGSGS